MSLSPSPRQRVGIIGRHTVPCGTVEGPCFCSYCNC
jgi:hypothetical protein